MMPWNPDIALARLRLIAVVLAAWAVEASAQGPAHTKDSSGSTALPADHRVHAIATLASTPSSVSPLTIATGYVFTGSGETGRARPRAELAAIYLRSHTAVTLDVGVTWGGPVGGLVLKSGIIVSSSQGLSLTGGVGCELYLPITDWMVVELHAGGSIGALWPLPVLYYGGGIAVH